MRHAASPGRWFGTHGGAVALAASVTLGRAFGGQPLAADAPRHPLDPLTPAEYQAAVAALWQAKHVDEHSRYPMITLQEPSKAEVWSWQPGQPMQRAAFLAVKQGAQTFLEWASLWDNRLDIRLGRIGAGDEFLASPLYTAFVNSAFNGTPGSVPTNIPSFSTYPVATWGFRAQVTPVEPWSVMIGLYYSDSTLARIGAHGLDFGIRSEAGAFVIGELGYRSNQGQGSSGLPGNYKIGAYVDSNAYADLSRGESAQIRGNYGLYVLLDQQVYREGGAQRAQGLTPFATLTFAPSNRNTFPWFFSAGLVYQGLIPGRDDDLAAFGLAYGRFSKYLSGQHYETVLEWTYALALAPWLTLQPDVQYIIQPSGMSNIANALVLGMQIAVNF